MKHIFNVETWIEKNNNIPLQNDSSCEIKNLYTEPRGDIE